MENTVTEGTTFGRVLGEFMESRGISPEPEQVRTLAVRTGLDADALLARVASEEHTYHGSIKGLADALGLSEVERFRLAHAFAFDRERTA